MKNYIVLNNQKIELTNNQVREMAKSLGVKQTTLADFSAGDVCTIGGYEFIVLEQSGDTTAVILKNLLVNGKQFGVNNNYNKSDVDEICNDFAAKIIEVVGQENIVEHTVDLTADDGLTDYGKIKRFASLLTCELYRRYVYILDKYKLHKWWWLATAFSTPTHEDSCWIKCVSPRGSVFSDNYCSNFGVRPFCIFRSNIFVSRED